MKEIILVEVIDGEELTSYAEAFTDVQEAERFWKTKVREFRPLITEEELDDCLDDGYFADDTRLSVLIKEIPFNN